MLAPMNDANHPMPHILSRRCLAAALVLVLVAGCGSSAPRPASTPSAPRPPIALPGTPAGAQARWLLAASAHLPIAAAVLAGHFDRRFLARISPGALNGALASVGAALPGSGRVRVDSIQVDKPRLLVAGIARAPGAAQLNVSLQLDGQGLISGLSFRPSTAAAPTSWRAIDVAVRSVAPDVRMLVADTTDGGCRPIHAIDPGVPAPLGSAFKLYVLDALGAAVASGSVSWEQPLTIGASMKSLPSGDLQLLPVGTRVSVREAADKMISISDNTAADMLIGLLGRPAVEAALARAGMSNPARNVPFLTTRELFMLKLEGWPALAARYTRAGVPARRAILAVLDRRGLPGVAAIRGWTAPRAVNTIEWFASADDLCRVNTSLSALARRPGLGAIAGALSLNDGGLGLDPRRWSTTWFKGGSEPGVLTLTYEARTRTGRTYFVAVLADNRSKAIDGSVADPRLLAAIKGAFALAAKSGA